jgi:hypothetical protein
VVGVGFGGAGALPSATSDLRRRRPRGGRDAGAEPAWPGARRAARPLHRGRRKRYRPLLLRLSHPLSVEAVRANARHLRVCHSLALHFVRVMIFGGAAIYRRGEAASDGGSG